MKEISRRSMFHTDEGICCGPMSISAIDAEIVLEDEGRTLYMHTQWVDADADNLFIEINSESVYDKEIEIYNYKMGSKEFYDAIAVRDHVRKTTEIQGVFLDTQYPEQFDALLTMNQELLDREGYNFNIRSLFEYEDEEEETEEK